VEREKSGLLRTFDPQTGEQNILAKYFKAASRDYGINVLRVDSLDFNIDIVSKVITEQSTPRFKGIADAKAATGGVWGLPKGKLTTDQKRVELANKNKQERAKFDKEQRMCKMLVNDGHNVRHLSDAGGGYDIELDGVPYELKSLTSANNIVKEGKNAISKQGAKGVVYEFSEITAKTRQEINKLKEKYDIHGYYFTKGENELHSF